MSDDDRMIAYDRTDRYYEIMGYDIPPSDSEEYRERFYDNLANVREERGE